MSKFGTPIGKALKELAKFELLQTGDTGHGKTTRALDATRFGPVYFFDFDGKLQGAVRNLTPEQRELISYDNYKDKDFNYAFDKLKELKGLYDRGEGPFATVVIDTFTLLNEKAYIKAMGSKLEKPGAKATFDEWGVINTDLLNFFNVLHTLPCNIIVNAHVAKTENAEGKQVLGVEGMGSFRNKIAKKMTDSHYLYFDIGKWHIRCAKSATLPANSNIDPKFIDKKGNVTTASLEIFDEFAYKVK